MKNIHILPTDKPSRLFENTDGGLSIDDELQPNGIMCQNINIYITNDEEIKEGDWVIKKYETKFPKSKANEVLQVNKINTNNGYLPNGNYYNFSNYLTVVVYDRPFQGSNDNDISRKSFNNGFKKIILTTDQDLIKDGVQAINDEFLEWFVKNPSCVDVEIEESYSMSQLSYSGIEYEIIISKEEPKQDNKWSESTGDITSDYFIAQSKAIQKCMHLDAEMAYRSLPKRGRSYSEEDMFNFLEFINNRYYGSFSIDKEDLQDWVEQFKK